MRFTPICCIVLILLASSNCLSQDRLFSPFDPNYPHRWWPIQKAPKAVLKTSTTFIKPIVLADGRSFPPSLTPEHMMVQSIAGLAAQAVNEGRCDEMVWVDFDDGETHKSDYLLWYADVVKNLNLDYHGTYTPWELLAYFKAKGIVKGYVLYSFDYSQGQTTTLRPESDHSANVASAASGILGGVMISEELEPLARQMGLEKLIDVRGKDEKWGFEQFKSKLNRHFILAQDPRMPHNRDIAIAHRMMVIFGIEEPTPTIYAWLEPLSSILGWNAPGEGEFVSQLSKYGHTCLSSNWAINLAILSAATENKPPLRFKSFDPSTIDFNDTRSAVAFILSDGDNVQWMLGGYLNNPYYWASPDHGKFPIGMPVPYPCLEQVSPVVLQRLQNSQPALTTVIFHGGGYIMPDLFGANYNDATRKELLTAHARRINYYANRSGCHNFMFLCDNVSSNSAQQAYGIYAQEIESLSGMFTVQYAPYEAGDGEIYWSKNSSGIEIPAVTAKYCLWANMNAVAPFSGSATPAKLARIINETAAQAKIQKKPLYSFVLIHAWSGFKKIADCNETNENAQYSEPDSTAGVSPAKWCSDRISKEVKIVSPEELLWRIRMAHNSEQTRAALRVGAN